MGERSTRIAEASGSIPLTSTIHPPSAENRPDLDPTRYKWRAAVMVTALILGLLLPFAAKAVHIDDPLFLWMAKQIVEHPADPYGINVNWSGLTEPMYLANQNPPGVAYWLAVLGAIGDWNEVTLHVSIALIAALAALGVYTLSVELGSPPVLSALMATLAPGFLVSATTLMSDVPMLTLYVWSLALWAQGMRGNSHARLLAAMVFIALATLTKYFGITALPLAFILALTRSVRPKGWWLHLSVPILFLIAYAVWGYSQYRVNLLGVAADYAAQSHWRSEPVASHVLKGLAFSGACAAPVLLFIPFLWKPRTLLAGGAIAIVMIGAGATPELFNSIMGSESDTSLWYRLQVCIWIVAGVHILVLTLVELWRRRDGTTALLSIWMAGTFVFSVFVNHMINARTLMPMLPALSILAAKRLAYNDGLHRHRIRYAIPLVAAIALSVWVNIGDYEFARASRDAAARFTVERNRFSEHVSVLHFWGFQYYMIAAGARPLENSAKPDVKSGRPIQPGDTLAIPNPSSMPSLPNPDVNPLLARYEIPMHSGISTMRGGAGFYSHFWGAVPFVIGRIPPEEFAFYEIRRLGN